MLPSIITYTGFLGYMISAAGAERLVLSLPAGADVDNWYAHYVMGQSSDFFRVTAAAATASGGTETAGEPWRLRSFASWPNIIGKSDEVDRSDTHVHEVGR